jgi:hypothetical protein
LSTGKKKERKISLYPIYRRKETRKSKHYDRNQWHIEKRPGTLGTKIYQDERKTRMYAIYRRKKLGRAGSMTVIYST